MQGQKKGLENNWLDSVGAALKARKGDTTYTIEMERQGQRKKTFNQR